MSEAGSTNSLALCCARRVLRITGVERLVLYFYLGSQKAQAQVRRESVPFRYPSLNLELRWLTPGTGP